jgi:hypothetical protein
MTDIRLASRPVVGGLIVPYIVDETRRPIDFKALNLNHVQKCATEHRCAVCGRRIAKRHAFIGPISHRSDRCFGDPWMHVGCADYVAANCPFVSGRRPVYRGESGIDDESLREAILHPYESESWMIIARGGRAHRDQTGAWHFEPAGVTGERTIRVAKAGALA